MYFHRHTEKCSLFVQTRLDLSPRRPPLRECVPFPRSRPSRVERGRRPPSGRSVAPGPSPQSVVKASSAEQRSVRSGRTTGAANLARHGPQRPYDPLPLRRRRIVALPARSHSATTRGTCAFSLLPSAPTPNNSAIASAPTCWTPKTGPSGQARAHTTMSPGNRHARERGFSRTLGQLVDPSWRSSPSAAGTSTSASSPLPTSSSAWVRNARRSDCASTGTATVAAAAWPTRTTPRDRDPHTRVREMKWVLRKPQCTS